MNSISKSILITSTNPIDREERARQMCMSEQIDRIDQNWVRMEGTIGIEDIRNIQKQIAFKPIQSKTKAVIIQDADTLTTVAQNALLKTLEEPPANTVLILLAGKKDIFLLTILSRCSIIELTSATNQLSESERNTIAELLNIENLQIGDKLKIAETLSKEKEEAAQTLKNSILLLRENLIKAPSKITAVRIQLMQDAYKTITTTNTNLRLALEHLFLSI